MMKIPEIKLLKNDTILIEQAAELPNVVIGITTGTNVVLTW